MNENETEQLQRDLHTYGYRKQLLKETEIQIYSLKQRIRRERKPHSVSYTGEIATFQCPKCKHIEFVPVSLKHVECRKCSCKEMKRITGREADLPKTKMVKVDAGKKVSSLVITLATLESLKEELIEDIKRLDLDEGLDALDEEQRKVIEDHYFKGVTFEYIGYDVNFSKSNVLKIKKKALWIIYKNSSKSVRGHLKSLV